MLQKLHGDAVGLSETVGRACALAENVSSKVRELDLVKGRLKNTLRHLGAIMDLKVAFRLYFFFSSSNLIYKFVVFFVKGLCGGCAGSDGER